MTYSCLKQTQFIDGEFSLRPLIQEDLEPIRQWRNEQISVLRQTRPLTKEDQANYWNHVLVPSFTHSHPDQILFAFLKGKKLIGYGGITHIDWQQRAGELSFLLNSCYTKNQIEYNRYFGRFLELIKQVALDSINMKRLFTETYNVRPGHIQELENHGFRYEKRISHAVNIEGRPVDSLIHGCKLK